MSQNNQYPGDSGVLHQSSASTAPPHPTLSPNSAYLADEVGCLSLGLLLIDATRYNLSRPGLAAVGFAASLALTLNQIVPHVRQQLVQDIALALNKDAVSQAARAGRAGGMIISFITEGPPMYAPADRAAWQQVLQAAAVLGTAPDEFRATAGS
jgi:hypothetical protein